MSLMHLLSAGRTLVSSGEPAPHYRLNARYRLPKFGSAKNPFTKPTETKPAIQVEMPMPAPVQEAPKIENAPLITEETNVMAVKETQPVSPTAVSVSTEVPTGKVHPILALLDAIDLWAGEFKAWLMKFDWAKLKKFITRRKPVAVPVTAKSAPAPMQAELSLEKVQVMRNDLSDADLEIVPMQQVSQPTAPKPVRRERKKTKTDTEPELVTVQA